MTVIAWIRRAVGQTVRRQGIADAAELSDLRTVVVRLQRDVAALTAAIERSESR